MCQNSVFNLMNSCNRFCHLGTYFRKMKPIISMKDPHLCQHEEVSKSTDNPANCDEKDDKSNEVITATWSSVSATSSEGGNSHN